MQKLRVGDEVIAISGKDKGKIGKIIKFDKVKGRLLVENVNVVKKHVKANPNANEPGGIKSKEAYIDYSNVAILNKLTNKKDKVVIKKLEDGTSVRCYKSNGEVIDA